MRFPSVIKIKSKEGKLPNLIIIGAQKCGTTSLHYYLSLHPQISMSKEKELNFFIEGQNWNKGLEWYTSHFKGEAKIYGESSPNYTHCTLFPGVPVRMYNVIPEAKLIYVVRDPIERMISHYIHNYSRGLENRSIEEALSDKKNNVYLYRSLYYMQLKQYLEYYSVSQILVITAEDIKDRRQLTLRRVFEFLEVDPSFYCRRYSIQQHSTARKRRKTKIGMRLARCAPAKLLSHLPSRFRWPIEDLLYWPFSQRVERPTVSTSLRQKVVETLSEDICRLRMFTGHNFENWCI